MKKVELNDKNILCNHLNSYICVTNIEKMLTTLLFTIIILVICVVLLSVKLLFKKNGKFVSTHIEGNAALREKGICCAKTQHKRDSMQKNLYDRLKEINE